MNRSAREVWQAGCLDKRQNGDFKAKQTRDERGNWRFATEVRREQAPKPRMISKNMESADRFFEGGPMKKALLSGIGISILMTSVGLTVQRNRAGNGARGSIVAVNDPMRPIKLPPPPTPTTSTTPRLANANGTLVAVNDPMRPIKLPPPPTPTSPINPPRLANTYRAAGTLVAANDPRRPIKLPPPPTPTTSTTPRLANAHSASGTLVVANDPMRPIKLPPPPSPTSPINPPAAPRLTAA